MMDYVQITNSSEPKVIGSTNGVFQVEIDERKLKGNKNIDEINRLFFSPFSDVKAFNDEVLSFTCDTIHGRLIKKANFTDLMGFSPYFMCCAFMISEKFLSALIDFGVPSKIYNVLPVEIKGNSSKAYILYVSMIPSEAIVYEKSVFYDSLRRDGDEPLRIESHIEFRNRLQSGSLFDHKRICLPRTLEGKDILNVQIAGYMFISSKLKSFLLDRGITSLEVPKNQVELTFE